MVASWLLIGACGDEAFSSGGYNGLTCLMFGHMIFAHCGMIDDAPSHCASLV